MNGRLGLSLVLFILAIGPRGFSQDAVEPKPPPFEITARLLLPKGDRFPKNRAFRSVALRMPWVYVLDRSGSLYVFHVPSEDLSKRLLKEVLDKVGAGGELDFLLEDSVTALQPSHVMEDVGDGNDLKIFGDVLVCTRMGALEAYSLKDPAKPQHLVRSGPEKERYSSQSIVRHGHIAFLVGKGSILCYDLTVPSEPKLLAAHTNKRYGWTGCAIGELLYVGEIDVGASGREGVAAYDIANLKQINEVGFVPTSHAPYHLFAISGGQMLASLDSGSWFHVVSGNRITVDGNSAIFNLAKSGAPTLAKEFGKSGGRSATVLSAHGKTYFVCNGVVFRVADQTLEKCFSFFPFGSTLDGLPYHGDNDGVYAALAADDEATIVRLRQKE